MPTAPHSEPFELFGQWFAEIENTGVKEPTAVTLATATPDGKPSARIILLKHFDERGFCFYTNLTSRKGYELKENPHAAITVYSMILGKQIRIEGKVERVTEKEADDYFLTRRRGSQIGAWASKQSMPMEKETDLPDRVKEITNEFGAAPIPRPPFWSGFRLVPEHIEFWTEGDYRLHTRLRYNAIIGGGWDVERLYP